MEVRIEILAPKKLVGVSAKMSFGKDATAQLWQSFMPRRAEVQHRVAPEYISLQKYADDQELIFAAETEYTKWAAVEVSEHADIPEGMGAYHLEGGLYAVFIHHGPAREFREVIRYIFEQWLPTSGYVLDHREHFEVLPEGYSPVDPNAQEEVWIPISAMQSQEQNGQVH